jgi:hypothetical protein
MKLISLILRFAEVLLQLVDKVARPVHLHSFYTLPCKVYYELCNLSRTVLSEELANYKMTNEAHYAILDGGYLVASLSFLYIAIIFFNALCQGVI